MPHVDPTADPLARAVTENAGRLYRLAYSYLKNEQDAMDMVQEAACRLLKNRGSVAPDRAFAWLWRVTVNASLDLLRRRRRESVGLPDAAEGREDSYQRLYLLDALQQLDEKSRAIVILRFFEDKPLAEIAGIMGMNLSTVKGRIYASLRVLRRYFEDREADEWPD